MVQKNITLEDYAWRITKVLESSGVIFKSDEQSKKCRELLLDSEAKMFFKNFGKEVTEKIMKAFDVSIQSIDDQEYYKVLVIFFTQIGSDNTRQFLGFLTMAMCKEDEG